MRKERLRNINLLATNYWISRWREQDLNSKHCHQGHLACCLPPGASRSSLCWRTAQHTLPEADLRILGYLKVKCPSVLFTPLSRIFTHFQSLLYGLPPGTQGCRYQRLKKNSLLYFTSMYFTWKLMSQPSLFLCDLGPARNFHPYLSSFPASTSH